MCIRNCPKRLDPEPNLMVKSEVRIRNSLWKKLLWKFLSKRRTHRRAWSQILITSMRIRIQLITLMRIRILLFIKDMRICDHWSPGSAGLYYEPSRLHGEHPRPSKMTPLSAFKKLLNYYFNTDPGPAFYPDPRIRTSNGSGFGSGFCSFRSTVTFKTNKK